MKNRGFAITSVIYSLLILFLALLLLILGNLSSRKAIFDKEKKEIIDKISAPDAPQVYENGQEVYFDVATGKKCNSETYNVDNSKIGYNGIDNKTATQNSCLKFYAFNDEGEQSQKVNLLLDHNTTAKIAWNPNNVNSYGPSAEFMDALKVATNDWVGTLAPDAYTAPIGYVVSYTYEENGETKPYKARIITAEEIATITGNTTWKTNSSKYYFDSLTTDVPACAGGNTGKCRYGWLYDRTSDCVDYGCNTNDSGTYGYWTSSAFSSSYSYYVWNVYQFGVLDYRYANTSSSYGIRPVITVLKSNLK